MSHHHYDIFAVRDADQPDSEGLLVSFFYDRRGRIDRLTIPFQPGVADIAFAQPRPRSATDPRWQV